MNFIRHFLSVCAITMLWAEPLSAQSIEALHRKAIETNQASAWNALAEKLYLERKNPELLDTATQNAIRLAQANNDSARWGEALVYASDLFYQKGEFHLYQEANHEALKLLKNTPAHGIKEIALNNIATSFGEQDKIDSLILYTRKAMRINRLYTGNKSRLGDECQNMSYAYSILGIADSAYHYIRSTIEALSESKDTLRLLDAYNQMGVFYVKKKQYPQALDYFKKALDVYELVDNTHNRLYIYTNLAAMYHKWGKEAEAVKFARHSLEEARGTAEKATYGKLLCNMGLYLHSDKKFRASADTLLQALPLVRESFYYLGTACQTLANNYEMLNKPDSCEYYLNKVDSLADTHQFVRGELFYAAKIALLVHRQDYKTAAAYARRFMELDAGKELTESSPYIYDMVSLALEKGAGDYQAALKYKKKAAAMQDTLYQREANRQLNEFYARYRTAEKDLKIASLKIERQQTRQKWILGIGGCVLAVIILSILVLYQRMKRIRKEKEATDLRLRIRQKEQELETMEKEMHTHILHSYFKGTEAERERLAKELHDNVANELLGISMLMKVRPEATEETALHLEKLYEEVRSISHDLTPPLFRHATLTKILEAHIRRLNLKEECCFELYMSDEEGLNGIGEKTSLAVYRIIQELTGNIVKYSGALSAVVDIQTGDRSLRLSVADEGKGFDPRRPTKGVGLQFVKSRVEELEGDFRLHTSVGKGCRIVITLPLHADDIHTEENGTEESRHITGR